MSFIYEYMNEAELSAETEYLKSHNEFMKIQHKFECVEAEHRIRMADIESRILFENYTEDDLTAAYTAEYTLFTEGVKELWEKFKAWIKGIVNAIFKRKPEKDVIDAATKSADEVELPYDPKGICALGHKVADTIKRIATFKKTDDKGNTSFDTAKALAFLGGTVVVSGGIAAGIKAVKKPTKRKASEIAEDLQEAEKAVKDISDAINSCTAADDAGSTNKGGENGNSVLNFIREISGQVINALNSFTAFIKEKLSSLFKKGSDKPKDGSGDESNDGATDGGAGKKIFNNSKERSVAKSAIIKAGVKLGIIKKDGSDGTYVTTDSGIKIGADIFEEIFNKAKNDKSGKYTAEDLDMFKKYVDWAKENQNVNEAVAYVEFVEGGFIMDGEEFVECTDISEMTLENLSDIESFGLDFGDMLESTTNTDSFTGLMQLVDEL